MAETFREPEASKETSEEQYKYRAADILMDFFVLELFHCSRVLSFLFLNLLFTFLTILSRSLRNK